MEKRTLLIAAAALLCGVLIYAAVKGSKKKEGYAQRWDPSGKDAQGNATWNPYITF